MFVGSGWEEGDYAGANGRDQGEIGGVTGGKWMCVGWIAGLLCMTALLSVLLSRRWR